MKQRNLGGQGLTTSLLGYGSMDSGLGNGGTYDDASVAAIRQAHDSGVTHFDTAELYGWGRGERLLGTALAPVRDEVTIATKFGFTPSFGQDSRPRHIRDVVEKSLRALGTERIDVLYQHIHDPAVPIEDVAGAMAELVNEGKVKYLGLSNTTPENARRAHAVHPISVVQVSYSLFDRGAEEYFPLSDELGFGVVAYRPLARGFLTGGVKHLSGYPADDFRQRNPWWAEGNYDANRNIVDQLDALAQNLGMSLAQLALAWLLTRRANIVPIPGSRNVQRVLENAAAADVELSSSDLARIETIVPNGAHV
ncbi:aldo/keto reductase [Frigoribacterium sp. CFBP9030]|uniref:aldo/keto reductase n=1 Tax=Frigoribacterium sp. CFBP9030 TaxID=3096537 RepID=UPI002A6A702E|nr:aldo/keto reductase [Frigoribacterium sp. CFBP9030]MDY0892767.1 aldo/keto reductase [Frigoribacterium sp. CFBP9030]